MAEIKLVKAFRIKDLGLFKSGSVIDVDGATAGELVERGIAENVQAPKSAPEAKTADDEAPAEDAGDQAKGDSEPKPTPEEKPKADGKPKPTDSVDAHRVYLKSRKVDPKGMTRAQMIKAIAGLDD